MAHLEDQRLHTTWQKVFTKLLGLQFVIKYKKGSDNRVADALSRRPQQEASLCAISTLRPAWMDEVLDSYHNDPQAQELLTRLALASDDEKHYTMHDGIIRYKNRLWLPADSTLIGKILEAFHASSTSGHSGFPVTFRQIKNLFYWKGMKLKVKQFVQECEICQHAKPGRAKYPGLLAPLPVPDEFWQIVTMDFMDGLPRSGRFNCVLVVVDKLSRYAHFVGLQHPYTAVSVAAAYMDSVHKLHGRPESIVSDRDPIFTSNFRKQMAALTGIKLRMSSSHHPQTDVTT